MPTAQPALPGFEGERRYVARMRRESDRSTTALRRAGRIEAVDAGWVALARTLADLIDAEVAGGEPDKWVIARLAGEWRAAMAELRGEADAGWNADLAKFFTDDAGAPQVRDGPES